MSARTAPDMFVIMHGAMRASARRLEATLAGLGQGEAVRVAALSTWFDGFCASVHHHHTVEDTIFFPALLERDAVAELVERMASDHHDLDDAFAGVRAALDGLATAGAAGWDQALLVARAAAARLSHVLLDHLEREEAFVLPRLGVFSPEEHQAMHDRAMESGDKADMPFSVAWIIESLHGPALAELMAWAPLPLKLLYKGVWRRRYERLTRHLSPVTHPPALAQAA
jgi:hypothetical protein